MTKVSITKKNAERLYKTLAKPIQHLIKSAIHKETDEALKHIKRGASTRKAGMRKASTHKRKYTRKYKSLTTFLEDKKATVKHIQLAKLTTEEAETLKHKIVTDSMENLKYLVYGIELVPGGGRSNSSARRLLTPTQPPYPLRFFGFAGP